MLVTKIYGNGKDTIMLYVPVYVVIIVYFIYNRNVLNQEMLYSSDNCYIVWIFICIFLNNHYELHI